MELSREIDRQMERIAQFADSPEFRRMFFDLVSLHPDLRHDFVSVVLLSPDRLRDHYGIVVPAGLKLQRSEFADRRPTLFCITAYLDRGGTWHKVTVTFDNPLGTSFEPVNYKAIESVAVTH